MKVFHFMVALKKLTVEKKGKIETKINIIYFHKNHILFAFSFSIRIFIDCK